MTLGLHSVGVATEILLLSEDEQGYHCYSNTEGALYNHLSTVVYALVTLSLIRTLDISCELDQHMWYADNYGVGATFNDPESNLTY